MSSSFKSPGETAKAVASIGGSKNNLSIASLAILGFLAGAYIAFGGMLAEICNAGMAAAGFPPGICKFVFGAVFPVGLIMVVICGSELFTGNVMYMTAGVLDGKSNIGDLCKNWAGSWVFNFVGALFVAFVLAYLSGLMTADPFMGNALTVANTKALGGASFLSAGKAVKSITWVQALIRGIGCNWLVCLAVYMAVASDDIIGKIVGIWVRIMAFVTLGFEHSVANMFFIPLGMFLGAKISVVQLLWNNLIPVTIGNIIGGALFVACAYWYVYVKE